MSKCSGIKSNNLLNIFAFQLSSVRDQKIIMALVIKLWTRTRGISSLPWMRCWSIAGYPKHWICQYPLIYWGGGRYCEIKGSCSRILVAQCLWPRLEPQPLTQELCALTAPPLGVEGAIHLIIGPRVLLLTSSGETLKFEGKQIKWILSQWTSNKKIIISVLFISLCSVRLVYLVITWQEEVEVQ